MMMRRSVWLILVLWGNVMLCFAQQKGTGAAFPDSSEAVLAELASDSARIFWLMDEAIRTTTFDLDLALEYSQQAYALAQKLEHPVILLNAVQTLGGCYLMKGNNVQAILLYEGALEGMSASFRAEQPQRVMRLNNNLGGGFYSLGDYDLAVHHFTEALNLAESLEDLQSAGLCYQNIGACFSASKQPETAESFFLRSIETKIQAGDSSQLVSSYLSLADLEVQTKKNVPAAIEYLEQAEAIAEAIQSKRQRGFVLHKRAVIRMAEEEWEAAADLLRQADRLAVEIGDMPQQCSVQGVLGNCLYELEQWKEAEIALRFAIELAEETQNLEQISYAYYWLAEVMAAQQDSTTAFRYFKEYEATKDSLRNINIQREMAAAESKFKVKAHQEAEEFERSEKEAANRLRNMAFVGSGLILLLGITLLWRERTLRVKQKELDRNKLESFTRSLIEKNAHIANLEEEIAAHPAQQGLEHIPFHELLEMKILTDEDWKHFQILFAKVHPGYIPRMRKQNPQLSPGDHRLFLLIKLQLNNKEIADILGISQQGVKVARHRLRKKIGLETAQSLEKFVSEV